MTKAEGLTRSFRQSATAPVLIVAGGCSLLPSAIQLRTAKEPAQACMAALAAGTLALNPESGLGLEAAQKPLPVVWPFGFSARVEQGRAVLVDPFGKVLARAGDEIEIGGGFSANDAFFTACGDVTVTNPAS